MHISTPRPRGFLKILRDVRLDIQTLGLHCILALPFETKWPAS
jgi:hypothetical protein